MVEAWYPKQLSSFAAALTANEHAGSLANSWPFHTSASPFLQSMLMALRSQECVWQLAGPGCYAFQAYPCSMVPLIIQ